MVTNEIEVPCPHCGKLFRPCDGRQRFCTKEHAQVYKRDRERLRSAERRAKVPAHPSAWTDEARALAAEKNRGSRKSKAAEEKRWNDAADRIRIAGLRDVSPYGSPAAAMMEA